MEKYEYQVVMHRIKEIEQEQLSWMEYMYNNLNIMVDVKKENMRVSMLQFRGKNNLIL